MRTHDRSARARTVAVVVSLVASSMSAIASADENVVAPNHVVGVVAERSGRVAATRIDPHGRASGVILADGTDIPARGAVAAQLAASVRPGDLVRMPGDNLGAIEVTQSASGATVAIGNGQTLARGGGPAMFGANGMPIPYARVDDASGLERITTTGRVRQMLHSASGLQTGFVMDDGTQVFTVPAVADAVAEQIGPGQLIRLEGRGTHTPDGAGMWAISITRPNGLVLLDMNRGIGAPELNLR